MIIFVALLRDSRSFFEPLLTTTMKYHLGLPVFLLAVLSAAGLHLKSTILGKRSFLLSSTWQNDLDTFLDVDTTCDARVDVAKQLSNKVNIITADVIDAVLDRDLNKIAPKDLEYGKSVRGLGTVRKQLFSDIIPDILQKGVPSALEKGPKLVSSLLSMGPAGMMERGKAAAEKLRKLTEDQTKLEATLSDVRKEIKNIVKRKPDGLETPAYMVLEKREFYEIRKYAPYSVCTTQATSAFSGGELASNSSRGFRTLASYISGNNKRDGESEKLSMTVPVMMEDSSMSFVLPAGLTATTAPQPVSDKVALQDIPEEIVAVREFTGFITEGEVSRQRAKLEDALINDSILYDSLSFKVMAYNSPLTLPWVRHNEVSFKVQLSPPAESLLTMGAAVATAPDMAADSAVGAASALSEDSADSRATTPPQKPITSAHVHFSAPEAGD